MDSFYVLHDNVLEIYKNRQKWVSREDSIINIHRTVCKQMTDVKLNWLLETI